MSLQALEQQQTAEREAYEAEHPTRTHKFMDYLSTAVDIADAPMGGAKALLGHPKVAKGLASLLRSPVSAGTVEDLSFAAMKLRQAKEPGPKDWEKLVRSEGKPYKESQLGEAEKSVESLLKRVRARPTEYAEQAEQLSHAWAGSQERAVATYMNPDSPGGSRLGRLVLAERPPKAGLEPTGETSYRPALIMGGQMSEIRHQPTGIYGVDVQALQHEHGHLIDMRVLQDVMDNPSNFGPDDLRFVKDLRAAAMLQGKKAWRPVGGEADIAAEAITAAEGAGRQLKPGEFQQLKEVRRGLGGQGLQPPSKVHAGPFTRTPATIEKAHRQEYVADLFETWAANPDALLPEVKDLLRPYYPESFTPQSAEDVMAAFHSPPR